MTEWPLELPLALTRETEPIGFNPYCSGMAIRTFVAAVQLLCEELFQSLL